MSCPTTNVLSDLHTTNNYWGNVSREKMRELNQRAIKYSSWHKAAMELIPEYLPAIEPFSRADVQYLLPIHNDSVILDAGAMWGALTIPIAQNCKEIYAIDKTAETLEFLRIRARQMGFFNIHTAVSNVSKLPFPNEFFDVIILNGVLEWIPMTQEINLETYWKGKLVGKTKYPASPQQMQLDALHELRRVLKPTGTLCLAIENRFGAQYLMGYPDDHVNIKYVPLMPRFMANIITRIVRGCDYRAYTYSLAGYQKLLKKSGFDNMQVYGVFLHYTHPESIVPTDMLDKWKLQVLPTRPIVKVFPSAWLKYVAPGYIAITGDKEPMLSRILQTAGVLQSPPVALVKCKSRMENNNTANFIVYAQDKNIPTHFCKVCRDNKHTDMLQDEAKNLKSVKSLLANTELGSSIPKLLYFGAIDGITSLVTQFITGSHFLGTNLGINLTRKNLAKIDVSMQIAIEFLVKFQTCTQSGEVEAQHLLYIIERQKEVLYKAGQLTTEVNLHIQNLVKEIASLKKIKIPVCAVHGDFDHCNILIDKDKKVLVDFEHYEPTGLPFFDLATLIFSRVIVTYRASETSDTFATWLAKSGLKQHISLWVQLYSRLSELPMQLLSLIAPIAVLEQHAKIYPYYRDPLTYPMRKQEMLSHLLALRIELRSSYV